MSLRRRSGNGFEIARFADRSFVANFPVPPYTADFCCVELKQVLEIDGAEYVTAEGQQRDRVRDEALARQGFLVVRFPGYDVLREPEQVLARIEECVRERMRELGVVSPTRCRPSPPAPLP